MLPTIFRRFVLPAIGVASLSAAHGGPANVSAPSVDSSSILWSSAPARKWPSETYPVGNGRLGFMAFGDTKTEHIQFNEDTLWIGDEKFTGAYQNFGDVFIDFGHRKPQNYRRQLDIRTGIETVTYTSGGVRYTREYFASYPARVLVFRFTADKPGAISAVVSLQDAHKAQTSVDGQTLVAAGNLTGYRFKGDREPYKIALDYEARVMVRNDGGTCTNDGGKITVKNADSLTIFLAAGTDFLPDRSKGWKGEHPHKRLVAQLATSSRTAYPELVSAHTKKFRSLMGTLSVDLGATDPALAAKPTAERLAAYKTGAKDPELEEMMFQFARYLLLSSSRKGGLPANLQGIWNNSNNPPWRCDFHSDVNIEMNYWFADVANLSECFTPYADWLASIHSVRAEETRKAFGTRGWLTHAENGPFGGSTWQWSKGDAAWMLQNLWDHYLFTLDKQYLETKAYPLMKSLCEFWVDHLKELPDGTLVSPNGYSPEHGPHEDGVSFDQQLVWNLFDDFQKASKVLGKDEAFRKKIAAMQKRLLGPKIGKWGQLQEWMVDRDNPKDKHRHLSHMIAVHPGHQISPRTAPKFAEAARVSMNARGDGATGWSKAWKISIWARLHDGDRAYKLLSEFLRNNVYPSLLGYHPPFHVRGIQARGAFTLDIEWVNQKLRQATILSRKGSECRIYAESPVTITCDGKPVEIRKTGNIVSFSTTPGKKYLVVAK